MFLQNETGDVDNLTALIGVGGILNGAKIGLITNNVSWTKATQIGDVVEPTYAGYAKVAVTWSSIFVAADGTYRVASQLAIFQPTMVSTDSITGYFLCDTAGTTLYGGDNFPAPIPLPFPTSRLAFTFEYNGSNQAQAVVAVVD